MLPILRSGNVGLYYSLLCRRSITSQPRLSQAAAQLVAVKQAEEDEYWETPQYPKIVDTSFESRKEAKAIDWQKEIQKTPTVEEKLIKINMPKYYGYKVVEMNESRLPYNCLPAIQHYTRTLLEQIGTEEDEIKKDEKVDSLIELVKGKVVDALELAHDYMRYNHFGESEMDPEKREQLFCQTVVEQINRVLVNALRQDFPHLTEMETDFNPRHEAFWAVGGIDPPKNVVKSMEGREWQKDMARKPVDRLMQYKSQPIMALRHRHQITPWKTEAEYNNIDEAKKLPIFRYDPRTLGYTTSYKHGTNIPGHWPGNTSGFGFISYQPRPRLHFNHPDGHMESIQAHAIQSSFAWLFALANYNGFNTYSELTYPMNTQTILTDGKNWSFYEYQLNTVLMNGRQFNENPRVNYCRGTTELKLYEDVDDHGKLVGFNEKTLHHLIRFYTNIPNVHRSSEELTPFLDNEHKYIANYKDEEKRTFLEHLFKHICANRPRHLEIPEIYQWEKIYKIDNKTRPLEPRRRFFELFINPWKRTLDQHAKEYIPKVVRPEGPKSRKKFKATYYP